MARKPKYISVDRPTRVGDLVKSTANGKRVRKVIAVYEGEVGRLRWEYDDDGNLLEKQEVHCYLELRNEHGEGRVSFAKSWQWYTIVPYAKLSRKAQKLYREHIAAKKRVSLKYTHLLGTMPCPRILHNPNFHKEMGVRGDKIEKLTKHLCDEEERLHREFVDQVDAEIINT